MQASFCNVPPPTTTNPYGAKRYAAHHDGMPATLLSFWCQGDPEMVSYSGLCRPNSSPKHSSVPNGK